MFRERDRERKSARKRDPAVLCRDRCLLRAGGRERDIEREGEREIERETVCVCVCKRERVRARLIEREREKERVRGNESQQGGGQGERREEMRESRRRGAAANFEANSLRKNDLGETRAHNFQ